MSDQVQDAAPPNIHLTPLLTSLYTMNVLSAFSIFGNALFMVCLLPFQTGANYGSTGPQWLYASGGLVVVFEYYLWALEMASYWFKPELTKLLYLQDTIIVDKWKKNSFYWGSALSAMTFGNAQGTLDPYLASKTGRIYLTTSFAAQNWLFYIYLLAIESQYPEYTNPELVVEDVEDVPTVRRMGDEALL